MEEIKTLKFWLKQARFNTKQSVREILDIETKSSLKEFWRLTAYLVEIYEYAEEIIDEIEKKLPF